LTGLQYTLDIITLKETNSTFGNRFPCTIPSAQFPHRHIKNLDIRNDDDDMRKIKGRE
jgi:hypothetical protein